MKDKLKKQLEMLKKSNKVDALLERGDIEEQALLNSSEDLHPADESHTFELLENSNSESIVAVSKSSSKHAKLVKTVKKHAPKAMPRKAKINTKIKILKKSSKKKRR